MSNFGIGNRLALGIYGGLLVFLGLVFPSNAATVITKEQDHLSVGFNTNDYNHNTIKYYNSIALSWQEIWQRIKRKKVAGGSRGVTNDFCLVSPSILVDRDSTEKQTDSLIEVWHQQPLFMWKSAKLKKIVLSNEEGFYWEQTIEPFQNHLFYDGKPLELGKTYKLTVFNPYETEIRNIQVVAEEEHQQIEADLIAVHIAVKHLNREETALVKADYFMQQKMYADALWELYAIENPTKKLKLTLEEINSHDFCP